MEHEKNKGCCGRFLLRIPLGIMFVGAGLMKLMQPENIIKMLGGMGFPTPAFFGWLLLLSEIIFGLAVLVGFRTKYTAWPLVVVLLVATFMVYLPNIGKDFITAMFHLLGIAALISLSIAGPGDFAVSKN